ncbi:hypothetical protein PGTUg99_024970 [Puccinia graminis f. sp. tritici]|uniref:Uncharacterized protein n=1 Tax=Puccinia graminis f. sp. tritici TaxID=56615 RepID=A0A5B0QL92_PUCGR|nr:hypothetical protein PGTUg99_024970 [Puccinia graminis f. sp. tritici]
MSRTSNLEFVRDPNLVHSSSCNLPLRTRTQKILSCSPQKDPNILQDHLPGDQDSYTQNNTSETASQTLKINLEKSLLKPYLKPCLSLLSTLLLTPLQLSLFPCTHRKPQGASRPPGNPLVAVHRWIVGLYTGSLQTAPQAATDPRNPPRSLGTAPGPSVSTLVGTIIGRPQTPSKAPSDRSNRSEASRGPRTRHRAIPTVAEADCDPQQRPRPLQTP